MGVHTISKYPEVRKALGITKDEPLFIIRAQDRMALGVVEHYRRAYIQSAMIESIDIEEQNRFTADLDKAMDAIQEWQTANPEKVKFPD